MRKRLGELSYYELLGVPPGAAHDQIKAAFHKFARKYHPDRADGEAGRAKFERIYRRGTEAYRVLSEPSQRGAYDVGLAQGRLRYDPADPAFNARPSAGTGGGAPSKARPFLLRAREAFAADDFKGARLHLKMALGYAPEWPEALELLGRVEEEDAKSG